MAADKRKLNPTRGNCGRRQEEKRIKSTHEEVGGDHLVQESGRQKHDTPMNKIHKTDTQPLYPGREEENSLVTCYGISVHNKGFEDDVDMEDVDMEDI